jgi:hypothetical protein
LIAARSLTHNLTLTEDSYCAGGVVLVIGADHITINLNGYLLGGQFGTIMTSDRHRFVTIEKGRMLAESPALVLNNARHFTIRHLSVEGDDGGIGLDRRLQQSSRQHHD